MVSTTPRPTTKPIQKSTRVSQGGGNPSGNISTGVLLAVWGTVLLGMGTQSVLTYQQLLERTRGELQQVAELKLTRLRLQNLTPADLESPAQLNAQLNNERAIGTKGYFVLIKRTDEGDRVVAQPEGTPRPTLQDIPRDVSAGLTQVGGELIAYSSADPIAGNLREKLRVMAVVPEAVVRDRFVQTSLLTTTGTAILLSLVILWFVAYLNRRLKPLVSQCEEVTEEKGGTGISSSGSNLDRLESALYQMVQQIDRHEEELKTEIAQVVQSQERQKIAQEMQQEQEASEQEVGILLEVVSSIEEGDLTVEAEVSDRATGLVADTLNRLRERLAETIARVLATAQQVALGAEELQTLARTVAANTVDQAQSVAQGRALTEQVAVSAQSSADQVKIANQALREIQSTVEAAQTTISKLTEGIGVLQKGSAQIVQRMKTLGEFVGLAEQFVQDQSQIASLTQVLAINATLVAARAAEQRDPKQFIGVAREFEAIAEQVNSLATQTNQGLTILRQRTGQIQAVVSAVDTEVQGLGGLVAGFTSGVEQSATAFQSVRQVTSQVVGVGQAVTESSLEIATAAGSTAKYMSEIATLAEQTANLTSTARFQAETMGTIAQELLAGIRFFRLPEAMLATADQLAELSEQVAEQVTVDAVSEEMLDGEELEDEWEDYLDYDLDYEDGSEAIAQMELEEEMPFTPTGYQSVEEDLSVQENLFVQEELDQIDNEIDNLGAEPQAYLMEALENEESSSEEFSSEEEIYSGVIAEPADDFDADDFVVTEFDDLEFSDPNYSQTPTLGATRTELPTLIEQADPDLDFDMVQDEIDADEFGISLEAIQEDLEAPEDFVVDAEDALEDEMEEMINPVAVTVVDDSAYLDFAEELTEEEVIEVKLEEMDASFTAVEPEDYPVFSSVNELEVILEEEPVNPLSETVRDLEEASESQTLLQQATVLEDELVLEDDLDFAIVEPEQESSAISADFDAHFDALVSSFTEAEEYPSVSDSSESADMDDMDLGDVYLEDVLEETMDDLEPSADVPVYALAVESEQVEELGSVVDSFEVKTDGEVIAILIEDDNGGESNQETLDQIFDLELNDDERSLDSPFAVDVIEDMNDDRDISVHEQPFQLGNDEFSLDVPNLDTPSLDTPSFDKSSTDEPNFNERFNEPEVDNLPVILAPPEGLSEADRAFVIDESIDINQPDLHDLEDEQKLNGLTLELLEDSDDSLQDLMALSEQLDDELSDSYDAGTTQELGENLDDNMSDDFLPVFASSQPKNDPDPFDFDLLSEETL